MILKLSLILAALFAAACADAPAMRAQPAPADDAPAPAVLELAQAPAVPATGAELAVTFAPVVRSAAPAVVNILTRRTVRTAPPMLADPFFRRFFGLDPDGPFAPRERVQTSLGSGVIVDPSGVIVTNNHVVTGAGALKVRLDGSDREMPARIVGVSECNDLAVIQLTEDDVTDRLEWSDAEVEPAAAGADREKVETAGGVFGT